MGATCLDGSVKVEDKVGHVVGVVGSSNPSHNQCVVHHAAVLDEAALCIKLLLSRTQWDGLRLYIMLLLHFRDQLGAT
jgi:hypothetical protein